MYRLLSIKQCLYWTNVLGLLTVNSVENYFSTAIQYDWFFNSLHIFGTPNAVITLLWSLLIDLTTISYSDNHKLDSSVFKNALTSMSIWRNGANLSSFTSQSDINVCWLPVSNKTLTTQNLSSRLFMTHALTVCNTIVVSLFTKQVAVCSLAGALCYYYFDQNWLYAANNFRGNIMRYDDFLLLYNKNILSYFDSFS